MKKQKVTQPGKKSKKSEPLIFFQDCGIFSNEIVVSLGAGKEEVLSFLDKHCCSSEARAWIEKQDKEMFESIDEDHQGMVCHEDGRLLLLLRPFENSWEYWETLLHELHHITLFLAQEKKMLAEFEGQAYLQGYLFKSIRRKLEEIEPITCNCSSCIKVIGYRQKVASVL